MNRFAAVILRRPRLTLAAVLLVSAVLATGLRFSETRPAFEGELPESNPIVRETTRFDQRHPDRKYHVLGLRAEPDLWSRASLEKLAALSRAAAALPGALPDVQSLATWDSVIADDEGIRLEPVLPPTLGGDEVVALRARVEADPLVSGRLLSRDGAMALVRVSFAEGTTAETVHAGLDGLRRRFQGPETIAIFGPDYVNVEIDRALAIHSAILLPLAGGLLLAFLYLCFGHLQAVWASLSVIVLTVIDYRGLMGLLEIPQSVVSSSIPVLLIVALGSNVIHLLQRVYEEAAARPWPDAVRAALRRTALPILLATLASAAGLVTLLVFEIYSVREFGILGAVGVLIAGILSLTWLPALLAVAGQRLPPERTLGRRAFVRLMRRMVEAVVALSERPARIKRAALAVALVALSGVSLLRVGSSPAKFFPSGHPVSDGFEALSEHFGANGFVFVELEAGGREGVYAPAFLRQVEAFQRDAERIDGVAYASSAVDRVFRRMNRKLSGDDPRAEVVPDSTAVVAQYAELFRWGAPHSFAAMMENTDPPRRLVVDVFADVGDAGEIETLVAALRLAANQHLAPEAIGFGGELVLWSAQNRYLVAGKLWNLADSIALVALLCVVALRSARLALAAVVPTTLASLAVLGLMGLLGIRLDLASCVTTAIVVGVGVDLAIHVILRREEAEAEGRGIGAAELRRTSLRRAAPPVLYDGISNIVAFSVFIASPIVPVRHFGWLICISMLACCAASLILLPALLERSEPELAIRSAA